MTRLSQEMDAISALVPNVLRRMECERDAALAEVERVTALAEQLAAALSDCQPEAAARRLQAALDGVPEPDTAWDRAIAALAAWKERDV